MRSTSSSSRKRLALICATQWTWAFAAMMSRKQGFRPLGVDGEIIVDKENGDLAALALGASLEQQQFIHNAFIGPKPDRISKESGHRAKFASVRAAASRLHGNDAERSPPVAEPLEHRSNGLRNNVELGEVERIPRNCRIGLKAWLALLAKFIHGSIGLFELAARGVRHDLRPGLIRLAKSDRVGMASCRFSGRALRRAFP